MRRWLYQLLFSFLGVRSLYREVVESERLTNVRGGIRRDLQSLLARVDRESLFFRGKFTSFLLATADVSDEDFFAAYAQLPTFSKQDYAQAGSAVMSEVWSKVDPASRELRFYGRPWESLGRLRRGNFLMPMATGGSSALPLVVWMTKHHMFSMLFTFFKCWYRMGWRPGDRMLVFYPRNTYNIDDMVKFNRYSWLTGFRYHLFDHIDEPAVRGLVDELNRFRPRLLLVFPSPMNVIAHTIRRFGIPLNHHPEWINVSGETFFDCQRRNIQGVFRRSKIEDSYGSVELGEIAHEAPGGGLEIFANVAYTETVPNESGQPELVVTRLHLADFPFIRYRMRDVATVECRRDAAGRERNVMTSIEGKDSNYILSDAGTRFYPSFFNRLVNEINDECDNGIIEIKVYERGQRELEIQLIIQTPTRSDEIRSRLLELLRSRISATMEFQIRFVDFIDHDYRRKYRVIERQGDVEFAGGIVGVAQKAATLQAIEMEAEGNGSPGGRATDHSNPADAARG
jgi:phenylacetate-CoA ligase